MGSRWTATCRRMPTIIRSRACAAFRNITSPRSAYGSKPGGVHHDRSIELAAGGDRERSVRTTLFWRKQSNRSEVARGGLSELAGRGRCDLGCEAFGPGGGSPTRSEPAVLPTDVWIFECLGAWNLCCRTRRHAGVGARDTGTRG